MAVNEYGEYEGIEDTCQHGRAGACKRCDEDESRMSNEHDGKVLPVAVWEGEIKIGGAVVKVYVLDDGRRIIDSVSFERFFGPNVGTTNVKDGEALATFCRGRGIPPV